MNTFYKALTQCHPADGISIERVEEDWERLRRSVIGGRLGIPDSRIGLALATGSLVTLLSSNEYAMMLNIQNEITGRLQNALADGPKAKAIIACLKHVKTQQSPF